MFELNSNGNGLGSHFNNDYFWPKLGDFLLKKLHHYVDLEVEHFAIMFEF
jgi:hypothetical protein